MSTKVSIAHGDSFHLSQEIFEGEKVFLQVEGSKYVRLENGSLALSIDPNLLTEIATKWLKEKDVFLEGGFFQVSSIFKDGSEISIDETGNYFWRSKEKFTKKKGKRIFVSASSPPSFTLDNYKEVLLREGLGQAFINTFAVAIPSTLITLIICSFFAYSLT